MNGPRLRLSARRLCYAVAGIAAIFLVYSFLLFVWPLPALYSGGGKWEDQGIDVSGARFLLRLAEIDLHQEGTYEIDASIGALHVYRMNFEIWFELSNNLNADDFFNGIALNVKCVDQVSGRIKYLHSGPLYTGSMWEESGTIFEGGLSHTIGKSSYYVFRASEPYTVDRLNPFIPIPWETSPARILEVKVIQGLRIESQPAKMTVRLAGGGYDMIRF